MTATPLVRDDAAKLRTLADWFDVQDAAAGNADNEVQRDLRRIAREVERLTAEVARVRELHQPGANLASGFRWCSHCVAQWPCDTIRALNYGGGAP